VSYAETRTSDDRRRRRLAVAGDNPTPEPTEGPGGVARLRDRLGDLPAASPWLPRRLWVRIVLGSAFGLALAVVGLLLARPFAWMPAVAPIAEHLLSGPRPVLSVYVTTALWILAAQFAGLIGWYRSHSESDFRGRYRIWAGLTGAFAAASFLAGTGVHVPLAAALAPLYRGPIWRPEVMTWLAPLTLFGLVLAWRMDRDLRRCLGGLWLTRIAAVTLLATGVGHLFAPELAREAWFPAALALGPVIGLGLLVLGLWMQACYVAYVCADPPEPVANPWWKRALSLLIGLWPFGGTSAEPAEEPKPTRRRKKADEETTEAAPKRRRKPAAKSRRTTKSRTRVKPEAEEEEETTDEEAADESWESEEDSGDEAADSNTGWDDWQEAEETAPARVAPAAKTAAAAPAPQRGSSSPTDDDEDDDDYRTDGPHANADLFKGLSKRQRRELKRQLREQERQRGE
jgi:hypothetical protein